MSAETSAASHDATGLAKAADRLHALDHAIRTPLGTLASAMELLKLAPDPGTATATLTMMERQVRQMTTQLEELRDIARALDALH